MWNIRWIQSYQKEAVLQKKSNYILPEESESFFIKKKSMHYDHGNLGVKLSWKYANEKYKKKILMVKDGWHQVQQGNGKDDCIHTFPKHNLFHNREDTFSKLARQILTWWDWWPLDEWRAPKYTCRRLRFTLIYFYYLFVEIS